MGSPSGSDAPDFYQLKVSLRGISPMVWRRLLVPGAATIADLHHILQIAMGWENLHLHKFDIYGKEYGISYAGGIGFSDIQERYSCRILLSGLATASSTNTTSGTAGSTRFASRSSRRKCRAIRVPFV